MDLVRDIYYSFYRSIEVFILLTLTLKTPLKQISVHHILRKNNKCLKKLNIDKA